MKASVGDRLVVVPTQMDQPTRDARILEVRGPDGTPPYLVEWADNGHHGLVFPGSDARVQHFGDEGSAAPAEAPGRVRTWKIELHVYEVDDETTAHAVLVGDAPQIESTGTARRDPRHLDVPLIGDEVAVARALYRLADRILATAAEDISGTVGKVPHIHP